jgi:hypothetical protein
MHLDAGSASEADRQLQRLIQLKCTSRTRRAADHRRHATSDTSAGSSGGLTHIFQLMTHLKALRKERDQARGQAAARDASGDQALAGTAAAGGKVQAAGWQEGVEHGRGDAEGGRPKLELEAMMPVGGASLAGGPGVGEQLPSSCDAMAVGKVGRVEGGGTEAAGGAPKVERQQMVAAGEPLAACAAPLEPSCRARQALLDVLKVGVEELEGAYDLLPAADQRRAGGKAGGGRQQADPAEARAGRVPQGAHSFELEVGGKVLPIRAASSPEHVVRDQGGWCAGHLQGGLGQVVLAQQVGGSLMAVVCNLA